MEITSNENYKFGTSQKEKQGKKVVEKFRSKTKLNPIITIAIIMVILLSSVNFILVYNFMNILKGL